MLRMFVVALHIYNHYYMYIHVILLACCLHNMFVSRCLLYMSFSCITLFNLCSLSCVDHIKDPYTFGGLFNSCFEIIQDKDHTPVLACWLYSGFGCCIMRFLLRCVFTQCQEYPALKVIPLFRVIVSYSEWIHIHVCRCTYTIYIIYEYMPRLIYPHVMTGLGCIRTLISHALLVLRSSNSLKIHEKNPAHWITLSYFTNPHSASQS